MGKLESQSFPFVPVLCPSVYTIMHNKHVLYTLEDHNDEVRKYYTLSISAHFSNLLSNISCLFLNNNRMGELH